MCFGRNLKGRAMKAVCVTDEWARKYLEMCEHRGMTYVPWLSRLAVYIAEGKELICGVQVYDTTGPFMFFEHLVTNETATARQRYQAVDMLIADGLTMCRIFGKLPQVMVRHRGIDSLLRKHGFQRDHAYAMTCALSNVEKHHVPVFASKPAHPWSRAAATIPAPQGDPEDDLGVYAEVLGGRAVEPAGASNGCAVD
jgi:hypothetical protein